MLSYPDLKIIEKDVLRSKGGNGGEVVDLDWSGDGAWVSLFFFLKLSDQNLNRLMDLSDSKACGHHPLRYRSILGVSSKIDGVGRRERYKCRVHARHYVQTNDFATES